MAALWIRFRPVLFVPVPVAVAVVLFAAAPPFQDEAIAVCDAPVYTSVSEDLHYDDAQVNVEISKCYLVASVALSLMDTQ